MRKLLCPSATNVISWNMNDNNSPTQKKSKTVKLVSVSAVAEYFLFLHQQDKALGIAEVDKWKLQKLLYYAQGYYTQIHGIGLFEEKMVRYLYGPYVPGLDDLMADRYLVTHQGKDGLTEEEKNFLNIVFTMKKYKTGWQLKDETHQESPYLDLELDEEITSMLLKKEFSKQKQQIRWYVAQYLVTKSPPHLLAFREYVQQQLASTINQHPFAVDSIELDVRTSFSEMKMGALANEFISKYLYPLELEKKADTVHSIYSRFHVVQQLACSAKYGNPRACYHLAQCIRSHFLFSDKHNEIIKKLEIRARDNANNDAVLFSWIAESEEQKLQCLEGQSTPENLYELGLLKRKKDDALPLFEEAHKGGVKRAKIEIARRQKTLEDAFQMYMSCGDEKTAEGYYNAALLLEQKKLKKNEPLPYTLFERSGELGSMEAVLKAMEYDLKNNKLEACRDRARYMMNLGDTSGWRKLGDWFRNKNSLKEARECYEQAGLQGLLPLAEIASNDTTREQLLKTAEKSQEAFWTALEMFISD